MIAHMARAACQEKRQRHENGRECVFWIWHRQDLTPYEQDVSQRHS